MHSISTPETRAIALLRQLRGIPEAILYSEAVHPDLSDTLRYLTHCGTIRKSRKRRGSQPTVAPALSTYLRLVARLRKQLHSMTTFFQSGVDAIIQSTTEYTDDPLLRIIRTGRDSEDQRATYGYGAEILFEEIHEWRKGSSTRSVREYVQQFKDAVELQNDYAFDSRYALLEQRAIGLGQIACQSRGLLNRLNHGYIPAFWAAFHQDSALMALLNCTNFLEMKTKFRQHLATQKMQSSAPHKSLPESFPDISRHNPRPQLLITTPHVIVPDTAPSIRLAMEGDIEGLQLLISRGQATPRDTSSSRGFTLVRWALYGGMRNHEMVKFLLNQGAFVDDASYHHVWDYAYRHKCTVSELQELQCVTLNPSNTYLLRAWAEEQNFPFIHQIVLGRASGSLIAELDKDPNAVHAKDSLGRTTLDWATAQAQLPNVKVLISRGSSVNTVDVEGRTTVLHAVDSHDDACLRIILEIGGNPKPELPNGIFRSTSLISATFGGLKAMVKMLIASRAKLDIRNPEGRTALDTALSRNHIECAGILRAALRKVNDD